METLIRDIRYGARSLLKRPGFTMIAVIALALGIGANTAIFSLVNAVLLQPLPFAEPDRLVWVWGNIRNGGNRASVSPPDFLDYRQQNTTFEEFAAAFGGPMPLNLTGSGEPERLTGAAVTGNYFKALGTPPALGRTFVLENEKPGNDQVAVLSYGLWQKRFAGDPNIVNKTVVLDGKNFAIIGVMPQGFNFPQSAELWVPINFEIAQRNENTQSALLAAHWQVERRSNACASSSRYGCDRQKTRRTVSRFEPVMEPAPGSASGAAGRQHASYAFNSFRRSWVCLANRLRKRGQPAVGARRGTTKGNRLADRFGCRTFSDRAANDH